METCNLTGRFPEVYKTLMTDYYHLEGIAVHRIQKEPGQAPEDGIMVAALVRDYTKKVAEKEFRLLDLLEVVHEHDFHVALTYLAQNCKEDEYVTSCLKAVGLRVEDKMVDEEGDEEEKLHFGEGFLDPDYEEEGLKFKAEKVDFRRPKHWGPLPQNHKDCVIHALNHLAGCRYYQTREQFMWVWQQQRHDRKELLDDLKGLQGLKIEDIPCVLWDKDMVPYKFKKAFAWRRAMIDKYLERDWTLTMELGGRMLSSVIVFSLCFEAGFGVVEHATTLKKSEDNLWYFLDSSRPYPLIYHPGAGIKHYWEQKLFLRNCWMLAVFYPEPIDLGENTVTVFEKHKSKFLGIAPDKLKELAQQMTQKQ